MQLDRARLEASFKKYGLEYRFEPGFEKRGHSFVRAAPMGVVCHHTAGAASGAYPSLRVVRDGRPGLDGPLANLGLARDGVVIGIAAGLAYHAGVGAWKGVKSGNSYFIGIEAESTGRGDWTPSQITTYPRLLAALRDAYALSPEWLIAHYEWALPKGRKVDVGLWPGGMAGLRAASEEVYDAAHKATTVPPAAPKPSVPSKVKAKATGKLVVDGKFGPSTVKALQKALGVTADGEYGKRTKVALQRHLGVTADGVVGPKTVKALQKLVGATPDGSWGQKTTVALQRALNSGKF